MPLFDFKCSKCGVTHEALLSRTELRYAKMECQRCGVKMERDTIQVPAPAAFKGGGWAKDLYSKPAPQRGAT